MEIRVCPHTKLINLEKLFQTFRHSSETAFHDLSHFHYYATSVTTNSPPSCAWLSVPVLMVGKITGIKIWIYVCTLFQENRAPKVQFPDIHKKSNIVIKYKNMHMYVYYRYDVEYKK